MTNPTYLYLRTLGPCDETSIAHAHAERLAVRIRRRQNEALAARTRLARELSRGTLSRRRGDHPMATYRRYSKLDLQAAINSCLSGKRTAREAAIFYSIPYHTLRKKVRAARLQQENEK